jgi:hypothetical protein
MAPDVLPAFLSEAAEPHQYLLHPSDALPSEPNALDALDGAHPDAAVDGCPSGRRSDHLADADAGKLAVQVPAVLPEDACLVPACWQLVPEV